MGVFNERSYEFVVKLILDWVFEKKGEIIMYLM